MTRTYTWHEDAAHPDEWFCSAEQKWKPKSEFSLRDNEQGLPQWDCKECRKKRARDRYANNKERVLTINRVSIQNSKEANREYVYEYLSTHPCQDCGQRNPALLTFDHVVGTKRNDISSMVNNGWSLESIQIEISKTEIVCFNCHMMREHRRRRGR